MNNDIITRIEKLEPNPTEAIVIGFNFDNIYPEDLQMMYNHIQSKFPNNTVVAIPDHISLQSCSKDVLENYISVIEEVINELG